MQVWPIVPWLCLIQSWGDFWAIFRKTQLQFLLQHVGSTNWSTPPGNDDECYYHAMTFWKFSTLWFVSLNTQRYLPRTFSGSCLNCPIHIPWFLFEWNHICGSRCRNRYHLLKECHEMSRIGWHGSLQNSISDDSIAVADCKFAIALNMPSSGVRIFRPGVTLFRVFTSMIQDTCITSWNLLKLCNCNSMTLKCVLNFFRNVWGRFCFMWDMVVLKPAFGASNSKAIGFPRGWSSLKIYIRALLW